MSESATREPGFYWITIGDHSLGVAEWREDKWRFCDPDRHSDNEPIEAVGEQLETPTGHTARSAQDAHQRTASVRTALERIQSPWGEPALTLLLITQCATVFALVPASAMNLSIPSGLVTALPLTFAALVIITSQGRTSFTMGMVALLLSGVVVVMEHWQTHRGETVAEDVIAAVTFTLLSIVVFKTVYGPGRFTGHRVRGAVVVYLNIGLIFTLLDRIIEAVSPGAYANLPSSEHQASVRAALEYFSFMTLTFVGYGDIVPIQPLARGVCMLETVIGQLFPATLLARTMARAMHVEVNKV
jgi:voltage-gated potassium channel Kch